MEFGWKPEYSVGVPTFDEHHRHFFELAGGMISQAKAPEVDCETLLERITYLGDYVMYHMAEEEKYFAVYGYPDASAHIAAHDVFRGQVREYLKQAESCPLGGRLIAVELAEFSTHWLVQHIMEVDKKYTEFFKDKEVK